MCFNRFGKTIEVCGTEECDISGAENTINSLLVSVFY